MVVKNQKLVTVLWVFKEEMSAYYIVTLWVFDWDGSAICAGIDVVVQLEFFFIYLMSL